MENIVRVIMIEEDSERNVDNVRTDCSNLYYNCACTYNTILCVVITS